MSAQALRTPRSCFGRRRVPPAAGRCVVASPAALGPPCLTSTLPEESDRNARRPAALHVVPAAAPALTGGAVAAVTAAVLPTPHLRTRWSH